MQNHSVDHADVAIIGGGPAGLSAALNLVRAKRSVLLLDASRPRNAATLRSHGFLSRDGVPPLELRALGRAEFESYPGSSFASASVTSVTREEGGFRVRARGVRGGPAVDALARTVVLASGLSETLPSIPGLRAWYGTSLHSCVECDAYEKHGARLVLIGESADLAERAVMIAHWSDNLVVFTNGVGQLSEADERALLGRGIRVDRRPIAEIEGERGAMTGIRMADGELVPGDAGFVRPQWNSMIDYAADLGLAVDGDGLCVVDADGRTSVPGIYAAGDLTTAGPTQLIIAAGAGAVAAATLNRDLIGALN